MTNDLIAKSLGVPPIIDVEIEKKEVNDDFKFARENLITTINDTMEQIEELKDIAVRSQNARYFEALNGFLKTSIEANRELVGLHKTNQDIHGKTGGEQNPKVVNQTLIMTSTELLSLIRGEDKNG